MLWKLFVLGEGTTSFSHFDQRSRSQQCQKDETENIFVFHKIQLIEKSANIIIADMDMVLKMIFTQL